ncbi:hypothetical protein [Aliikangiella sp. IMCC44359]|uniref:hypothetical protein n=1 Tax=Aliikangiella sp. IMCC44359 TaxID=3459125 RepID=UPI00403A9987
MFKLKVALVSILIGPQVCAHENAVRIESSYMMAANGAESTNYDYFYNLRDLPNQPFRQYAYLKDDRVSGDGSHALVRHSTSVKHPSKYTGTVNFQCDEFYTNGSVDGGGSNSDEIPSYYGTLYCSNKWGYIFKVDSESYLKINISGGSSAFPIGNGHRSFSVGRPNLSSPVGTIQYAQKYSGGLEHPYPDHEPGGYIGYFVDNVTSVGGRIDPGVHQMNFTLSDGAGSGGIPPQFRNAKFKLSWNIFSSRYSLTAQRNSDNLYDAQDNVIDTVINDSSGTGNSVYSMDKRARWTSEYLPIDISNNYKLSGRFKAESDDGSFIYFGIESYDENYQLIDSMGSNRRGTDGVFELLSGNILMFKGAVEGWANNDSNPVKRGLGIYFDGNLSKRPDYIIPLTTEGAYQSVDSHSIRLLNELPEEVASQLVPGVTVFKNHQKSSSHIYIAGENINQEWTSFERNFSGISWQNSHSQFRPETKYVKIYVAGNWNHNDSNSSKTLLFDDLILEKLN